MKGSVNIRALELDFFMLFLQEYPTVLLGKKLGKSNGMITAQKARIRDLDKAIEDALVGKLPIQALEAKLATLVKEREAVGRALEETNLKMLSAASAPFALDSIKETLTAFGDLPNDHAGTKEEG